MNYFGHFLVKNDIHELIAICGPFLHRSFLTAQHLRDCDWAVEFKINMSNSNRSIKKI